MRCAHSHANAVRAQKGVLRQLVPSPNLYWSIQGDIQNYIRHLSSNQSKRSTKREVEGWATTRPIFFTDLEQMAITLTIVAELAKDTLRDGGRVDFQHAISGSPDPRRSASIRKVSEKPHLSSYFSVFKSFSERHLCTYTMHTRWLRHMLRLWNHLHKTVHGHQHTP